MIILGVLTLNARRIVKWSLFATVNSFFFWLTSSLRSKGIMKGDFCDRLAAIVNTESKQLNMAPYRSSLPILTSTGKAAKWRPRGVKFSSLSRAPTWNSRVIAPVMLSSDGGSKIPPVRLFSSEFYCQLLSGITCT